MMEAVRRVPRKAKAGYTWISAHTPTGVADVLHQVARRERRTMSNLIIVLLIEALRARGEAIPDDPEQDAERA